MGLHTAATLKPRNFLSSQNILVLWTCVCLRQELKVSQCLSCLNTKCLRAIILHLSCSDIQAVLKGSARGYQVVLKSSNVTFGVIQSEPKILCLVKTYIDIQILFYGVLS